MPLEPEVQSYLQEVLRLLYLHPMEKRRLARGIAARIGETAARGGLEAVRSELGEPRRYAAEIMLDLAESGRRPVGMTAGYYRSYEYKSAATWMGLPLVHVVAGYDPVTGQPRVAKGVLAVGPVALGVCAVGGIGLGLFSFGGVALGLGLALGGLAAGGWCALGGLAAAGAYAFGALAVAGRVAMGAVAIAPAAAGGAAIGRDTVADGATRAQFMGWLARNMPFLTRFF